MTPARFCLGPLTVALLAGTGVSGQSNEVARPLLAAMPVRGQVTVTSVQESSTEVMVQIEGDPTCAPQMHVARTLAPLSTMAIQAWLLRSDGAPTMQHRKPTGIRVGNGGCEADSMQFWFAPVRPARPIGIVISVNGKLTVTAVPMSSAGFDSPGANAATSPPARAVSARSQTKWTFAVPDPTSGIQRMTVTNYPSTQGLTGSLLVHLMGISEPEPGFIGRIPTPRPVAKPLADMHLQVWVLRSDGTTQPQKKHNIPGGLGWGGWVTQSEEFAFDPAERAELTAILISANGKLLLREVPAK
ncbi:MAG TPA: hypothetical protein VFV78_07245 [Vicinamibacterales bacterium]|nr:hypothetical protein [Vicinamibacterales bacterium]